MNETVLKGREIVKGFIILQNKSSLSPKYILFNLSLSPMKLFKAFLKKRLFPTPGGPLITINCFLFCLITSFII